MKKLLVLLSAVFLSLAIVQSASVFIRWTPNKQLLVNGLPAKYIKISYGSQLKTYTNSITWPLTNLSSAVYRGYDPFNCYLVDVSNCVIVPIYGLKLNQQIYYSYSIINSNGEERLINDGSCGFTVTNNFNGVLAPQNLRITL